MIFKKKVLFILHVPPPVHGSAVIGMQIKQSSIINSEFNCHFINLGTSRSINEIGKKEFFKLLRFVSILFKVLFQLIIFRSKHCYFAITAKGPAFYKDAFIIIFLKIFRVKLIYHFHNKGVSLRQDKWFDNLLYRIIFVNSELILLSKFLYPDVQKYFSKEDIYFCPNGIPDKARNNLGHFCKDKDSLVNILFFSNLIESKGVYILLEACEILKQNNVNSIFLNILIKKINKQNPY